MSLRLGRGSRTYAGARKSAASEGQGELFLKNGNGGTEYVMAGERVVGIKRQEFLFLSGGNLPIGIIANTAAIMGITLGKQMPEAVGADVYDRTGNGHLRDYRISSAGLKGQCGGDQGYP